MHVEQLCVQIVSSVVMPSHRYTLGRVDHSVLHRDLITSTLRVIMNDETPIDRMHMTS